MQCINVRRIAGVIGSLVDQISDGDIHHSRRVAVMAWRVGRRMKLSAEDLDDLLVASLIHDCGIDSPREYMATVNHLGWGSEDAHCQRGCELIRDCSLLSRYGNIVRYHHTPWRQLHDADISEREKILTNILFCVDRSYVGYHAMCHQVGADNIINHKSEIMQTLERLGEHAVAPDIKQAFLDVARTDGFWMSLYPDFLDSALSPLNNDDGEVRQVTLEQMRNVGALISRLVDVKSHFTHDHSERVSFIATQLAERIGLDAASVQELEIAALLHDVGKQKAPESILLKPGQLDDNERAIIKRHAIGTEMVLNSLFPDSKLVEWAANHHEKMDGSGYPYGLEASQLDICSRILTVSDIFQALTQERPYRGRMSCGDAIDLIGNMVDKGELDSEIFQVLKMDSPLFYQLSVQE